MRVLEYTKSSIPILFIFEALAGQSSDIERVSRGKPGFDSRSK